MILIRCYYKSSKICASHEFVLGFKAAKNELREDYDNIADLNNKIKEEEKKLNEPPGKFLEKGNFSKRELVLKMKFHKKN